MPMTYRPSIKVCDPSDYDGRVLIESFEFWNGRSEPTWAVPAWEEIGLSELCGPFRSVEEAQAAIDAAFYAGAA
jgi:hypothetical protein